MSNAEMGLVFEELIRKFADLSNDPAGEHFTPRKVIRLMVNLIVIENSEALSKPGVVRTLYDATGRTGGMLSVGEEHRLALNPLARLVMYGQELNPESDAICKAAMLIEGQDIRNIIFGKTLSDDSFSSLCFDYMLSNPPFGVDWKKIETFIRREAEQLIDASSLWQKLGNSLGSKCKELILAPIEEITRLFGNLEAAEKDGKPIGKIFRHEDFGYHTISVERPLRDEAGNVVLGQRGKAKGQPQAGSSLRDTENVPLSDDMKTYSNARRCPMCLMPGSTRTR